MSKKNLLLKAKEKSHLSARQFSLKEVAYNVFSNTNKKISRITGQVWKYMIKKDETKVGSIMKKHGNILKELFTDSDTFVISFPENSTEEQRALLLAATLRIDMTHFEENTLLSS